MADEEQLAILRQGVDSWNAWRKQDTVLPDLSGADLHGVILTNANLKNADLEHANLAGTNFNSADLTQAFLTGANLTGADLSHAHLAASTLPRAKLPYADLTAAVLSFADLTNADLTGASLVGAQLIGATLTRANLTGCHVYGISAWDLELEGAEQKNLIITPHGVAEITVDNLEVAQFIYLLLNNARVRHVIDTITSKVVLILGRFTPERKVVLDALREALRQRDYLPVLFDFAKPASRTTVETISTLAHMARFVIADLTDARSVLQELQAVVPTNPSVPVQPLILATQEEPGMFDHIRTFQQVLEPYRYHDPAGLLAALTDSVITPAELVLSRG